MSQILIILNLVVLPVLSETFWTVEDDSLNSFIYFEAFNFCRMNPPILFVIPKGNLWPK